MVASPLRLGRLFFPSDIGGISGGLSDSEISFFPVWAAVAVASVLELPHMTSNRKSMFFELFSVAVEDFRLCLDVLILRGASFRSAIKQKIERET